MNLEAIFDDAADLDAGQGEDYGVDLVVLGLEVHQVGGLDGEWNDGSVGMDGAALDVGDGVDAMHNRGSPDSGEFLSLLLEHFDALVIAFEVVGNVGDLFAVEVNGGGARGFGIVGHFEFFGGGLLELSEQEGWRGDGE